MKKGDAKKTMKNKNSKEYDEIIKKHINDIIKTFITYIKGLNNDGFTINEIIEKLESLKDE